MSDAAAERAVSGANIVALAGGVGGAKLAPVHEVDERSADADDDMASRSNDHGHVGLDCDALDDDMARFCCSGMGIWCAFDPTTG